MDVIFVAGYPCSGKSHFIKEHFSDYHVIDVFDFQRGCGSYQDFLVADEKVREALLKAVKDNQNVVVENTFYKAFRRKLYFDVVKSKKDLPVKLYVLDPSAETHKKRSEERGMNFELDLKPQYGDFEYPSYDEGFDEIYIVKDNGISKLGVG